MKRITLILFFLTFNSTYAQDFNRSMAKIMKNMKTYTVELVDKMPAENLITDQLILQELLPNKFNI